MITTISMISVIIIISVVIVIGGLMFQRRENVVGVSLVLAEYHQIQTWLL